MTPADRLRSLVKEATPGPWIASGRRIIEMNHRAAIAHTSDFYSNEADARLYALAPQLAELVADAAALIDGSTRASTWTEDAALWLTRLAALFPEDSA